MKLGPVLKKNNNQRTPKMGTRKPRLAELFTIAELNIQATHKWVKEITMYRTPPQYTDITFMKVTYSKQSSFK